MMKPVNESIYAYGASDCLLEDADFTAYPDLQMIPVVAG